MIAPDVLRHAQLIMLDMLVEFDAICTKHHLRYWLDSGTLLGAVRHQGFIPWDDDIDISMPVEDYHTFLEIAGSELSSEIFLQTTHTDKNFRFDYAKLRSNRAHIIEFHEKHQKIDYHQGVFIDLFPMLAVENSEASKNSYHEMLHEIRQLSAIGLHTPNGRDDPAERANLVATLRQQHLGWGLNNTIVIYGGEMPDVSAWFESTKVFPLASMPFEGREFPVPGDPAHYLNAIYPFDYRELPPESERTTHAYRIEITRP